MSLMVEQSYRNREVAKNKEIRKRLAVVSSKSSLDLGNDRKGRVAVPNSSIKCAFGFMVYMVIP